MKIYESCEKSVVVNEKNIFFHNKKQAEACFILLNILKYVAVHPLELNTYRNHPVILFSIPPLLFQ